MKEVEFAQRLKGAGARVFLVGGWVRDYVRGVEPHDKDYMVTGITEETFTELLPEAVKVGKSFPVYLVEIDGVNSEVAFARKEKKTGSGYCGFAVDYDSSVTVEEDLYRRDTTMNSLAMELPQGNIIDLYGGIDDVHQRRIRAVSAHFCEDPVRALRAARQAAEFDFTISEETYDLMRACRDELQAEPAERLLAELRRALQTPKPSRYFRCLAQAGLLPVTFPELAALIGKTQPAAFHPEGDAFEHTMLVLDTIAAETDSLLARFAGLVHDLGKGQTPKSMEPHHYGHEKRGLEVLKAWNARMTLPRDWLQGGLFIIEQHMRAPRLTKPAKIVDLLLAVEKSCLTWAEFKAVIRADHHSLPHYLEKAEQIVCQLKAIRGKDCPAEITGPRVGEWIRNQQVLLYRNIVIDSDCAD